MYSGYFIPLVGGGEISLELNKGQFSTPLQKLAKLFYSFCQFWDDLQINRYKPKKKKLGYYW